ncbi:uncharacterized protein BDV17DRAFT_291212 [Aspergillus undulatus]|uniref:uncharacterized protein n=1 Tax=Aspergillus undulatus TaxID=1810928 RepID=UPI003CCD0217
MLYPSAFIDFIRRGIRRRSTGSGQEVIEQSYPAACLDECSLSSEESQSVGNDPDICSPDSSFWHLYDGCTSCIEESISTGNSTGNSMGEQAGGNVNELEQFADFCEAERNTTVSVRIDELLSSWSSLASTQSVIQDMLSSLGYNSSSTTTTPNTSIFHGSTTITATSTPTASDNQNETARAPVSDSTSPNLGVIIPAIVVPVLIIPLASLFAACVVMGRRRRRRIEFEQRRAAGELYVGKAQHHADPAVAVVKNRASETSRTSAGEIAELPAREPRGGRMDASSNGRDM